MDKDERCLREIVAAQTERLEISKFAASIRLACPVERRPRAVKALKAPGDAAGMRLFLQTGLYAGRNGGAR